MNWSNTDLKNLCKLAVRTSDYDALTCADNEGSGLLCCVNGKTYLLTAAHCAQNYDNDNFTVEQLDNLENGITKFKKIRVIRKCFPLSDSEKELDYAIFEVENPNNGFLNESRLIFEDPSEQTFDNTKYFTYGYPQKFRDGYPVNVYYLYPTSWKLDVETNPSKTFHEMIVGYSGAPIISSIDGSKFNFFAIQKKTFDSSGSFHSVKSTFATYYLSKIKSIGKPIYDLSFVKQSILDNEDYIERKVQLWNPNSLSLYLDKEEKKRTLYDYITEQVPEIQSFRFVLIAAAQSGKSYELKHLAHKLAEEEYAVVFKEGKHLTKQELEELPKQEIYDGHSSVVIIDALDEAKIGFESVLNFLKNYCDEYPTIKIIVSCRQNYDLDKRLKRFTPLYLSDIYYEDSVPIIDSKIAEEEKANQLKEYIRKAEVQEFAHNIFCLLRLIETLNSGGKLPTNRAELYDLYITQSPITDPEKIKKQRLFQQKCAFALMMTGNQSLTKEDLLRIEEVDDFSLLDSKLSRNVFNSTDDNRYEFINNAIKEFLVAELFRNYSLTNIQEIVCFHGTTEIKPQWYNVVMLWLQIKSKETQPLDENIIKWVARASNELIIQCDVSSIDVATRFLLVQNILEGHKRQGTIYSAIYTEAYKHLYKFAESAELIKYIANELTNVGDQYIYNTLCLTPYINYDRLKSDDIELYSKLIDALFSIVEKFGNTEHCGGCYYFIYLSNHFYSNEEYVNRLFSIICDWRNQDAVNSMAAVCCRGNWSDKYAEWFLQCEPALRQDGMNFFHRGPIYMALSQVQNKNMAGKILAHITEPIILQRENNADDYFEMLQSLLSTIAQNKEDELIGIVKQSFDKIFVEHPYTLGPNLFQKVFNEFKSFFDSVCPEKEEVQESIKKVEHFGKPSPEQMEEIRKKRQTAFNEMCDYELFSEKIHNVANIRIERDSDPASYVYKSGYGSDIHIINFILATGCIGSFNKELVLDKISDLSFFRDFRMCEIANALLHKNYGITVDEKQISYASENAINKLKETDGTQSFYSHEVLKQSINLLIAGYVEIDDDTLISLIPKYANESLTQSALSEDGSFDASTTNLLQYAERKLGKEVLIDHLTQWVNKCSDIGDPQFLLFIDYLIANADGKVLDTAFESVLSHPNPAVTELLSEKFINIDRYRNTLKEKFDVLSENCKMMILSNSLENENESSWAQIKLEQIFETLKPFNKNRAIYLLLKSGSKFMLEFVNRNREEVLTQNYGYLFCYNDPSCLDTLVDLYPYVSKKEDIMLHSSNSILVSIGNIAQQSKELLEKAEAAIKKFAEELEKPILLRQIENYRMLYYKRIDKQMTMDEAIEIVNKLNIDINK